MKIDKLNVFNSQKEESNMKEKTMKTFFALATVLLTSAFAIPKGPCDKVDTCCDEPAPGPFAFSYPKDLGLACSNDFYARGDFLYMRATQDGLEYVLDQDTTGSSSAFPLTDGKIKGFSRDSTSWEWRPGFRVGIGFNSTKNDTWSLDAYWTYFRIKADSTALNNGSGVLLGLLWPPVANQAIPMTYSNARFEGTVNTLDISMGKAYHVSRQFVSNPMFGIRGAWMEQDFYARYFVNHRKSIVAHKNDFRGVGLRGSYMAQFLFGSHFSIYGNAAMSLLFGKFDLSQSSDDNTGITWITGNDITYKVEDSYYSVKPNAELGIGITWGKMFDKDKYMVSLKVGYEFHHWFDQNQLRRFYNANPIATDTVSRGDLSFNGFVFGLNFDF